MAFSCKGRGLCPSCGAKRAAERAAFLVDEVVEEVGHAQWASRSRRPLHPASLGLAASVLVLIALLASIVPARRAASIDPVRALQTE